MKKLYLALFAASCLMEQTAHGQSISTYTFAQFTGSYTAITGGTLYGANYNDDEDYVDPSNPTGTSNPSTGPGIPIGFNFTYGGNIYDVFGINTNGYIFLGQSSLASSAVNSDRGNNFSSYILPLDYSSSNAPTVLQNQIGGFAVDLQEKSTSSLRVKTIGTAPNRTLVVQFADFEEDFNGDDVYFQIRLSETSNFIDVVYGAFNITGYNAAQVGLRGSAAVTDFNMRDVNWNSSSTWATSTLASDISVECDYGSVQPISGQTYHWGPPPPCTASPASNTIIATTTLVCPGYGQANLTITNPYNFSGITYQWKSSPTSTGTYTNVANGNSASLLTPTTTAAAWYELVATCSFQGLPTTISAVQIQVAGTTTNSAPYMESFEGSTSGYDELPNCSWFSNNPSVCSTSTYTGNYNQFANTGNGFAWFDCTNGGNGNYSFYSNGVALYAGVTYSASVWYLTEGYQALKNFSLAIGPNQNSAGSMSLGIVASPQNSNYALLSNTFVVPSSGLYYLSVNASDNGNYGYLTFDDLAITIPCQIAPNSPVVSVSSPSAICLGHSASLSASGANSYTWSSGPTTASISPSPIVNTTYTVSGTKAISGCVTMTTAQVYVNPSPGIQILPIDSILCKGQSMILLATGSDSYVWTNGPSSPVNQVSPTSTTAYTVTGSNIFGCTATGVRVVTIDTPPAISVSGNTLICLGERANLTASGANTYSWSSSSSFIQGASISVAPSNAVTYTVIGNDDSGCPGTTVISVTVDKCLGIASITGNSAAIVLYPNPSNGEFTVELNNGLTKNIDVFDLSGRIVLSATTDNDLVKFNLSNFANGIYYVKVKSDNTTNMLKVVKQ